jgi:hypothetical protein
MQNRHIAAVIGQELSSRLIVPQIGNSAGLLRSRVILPELGRAI